MVICINAVCGWIGKKENTIIFAKKKGYLFCPECGSEVEEYEDNDVLDVRGDTNE